MHATVVGGGVSGLTTAAALLEAGWDVEIVQREPYESTVSIVAAAVWTATMSEPFERAREWALASWHRFAALADQPATGVARLRQRELELRDPGPTWWETTAQVRRLEPHQLPAGYGAGFEIDGFIIEPPTYLPWLRDRVVAHGGRLRTAAVSELGDLDADLVVNCTGLAAASLTGDDSLYPIRGQVVAVANPGIHDAVSDESVGDRITYVYPRSAEVVLGGVRQERRTDPEPDDATTARILSDCAELDPRVAGLDPLAVRVGLRPGRPEVRVEQEALAGGQALIHNYGHGGAGYILSWGCAEEVVALAR